MKGKQEFFLLRVMQPVERVALFRIYVIITDRQMKLEEGFFYRGI